MVGWIGDDPKDVFPVLFADADFAGCLKTARSTSGVFLALHGPATRFPLQAISKRQSCVSHSTPEAEIVAADMALRTVGIPAIELWSAILQRPNLVLEFREDNQAMIKVMASGHSPTMRHLSRTHRVDLKWLSECFVQPCAGLKYCHTKRQAGGICTKAFHEPDK